MRIHDGLIGAVLLILSLAVLWHIRIFPPVPGQDYGSAVFPGMIAGGLALASAGLMWQGYRDKQPWIQVGEGMRSGRHVLAFFIAIASMLFYIVLADKLGFIVCSIVILVALQWATGVPWGLNLTAALVATLAIHTAFYKLLKVPLPWGVLESFAW
ncbi:MAG: tripartite tricarboxylate transporter TctB family protein [Burkholderiales bacterium]